LFIVEEAVVLVNDFPQSLKVALRGVRELFLIHT
jgi:hypothetical protein